MTDELTKKLYHLKITIKGGILFGIMGIFLVVFVGMSATDIKMSSDEIFKFTTMISCTSGALLFWGCNTWIYFKRFEKEFKNNHNKIGSLNSDSTDAPSE